MSTPDETCQAAHRVLCGILGIVRCTRAAGHVGDHLVTDGQRDVHGNEVEYARWPQQCACCAGAGQVNA